MAPSASLQARIKQFESLDDARLSKTSDVDRTSYPPARSCKPPLSGSDLMSEPVSPTAASYTIIKPTVPYAPRKPKSPSPSPPNLGLKTSLIDLKEWVVEDGPHTRPRSTKANVNRPLKSVVAPPLPPRKASQSSNGSSSTSSGSRSPYTIPSAGITRSASNSLTVEHTYPPLSKMPSNSNMRHGQGHVHASSTSSFHSVSLSSDGGTESSSSVANFISTHPMDNQRESVENEPGRSRDRDSISESFSFETASSTSVSSPTLSSTHEWEKDFTTQSFRPEPPRLPSRTISLNKQPSSPSISPSPKSCPSLPSSPRPSLSSSPHPGAIRRVPPPPPSRFNKPPASASNRSSLMSTTTASDRSSIFSTTTVTTSHTSIGSYTQLLRPTPIPLVARKRYEAVFFANVNAQRRVTWSKLSPHTSSRNSASQSSMSPVTPRKGWRGLSVDLITNPEENPCPPAFEEDLESSRLEGDVVKAVWTKSRIHPDRLRDVWNECAFPGRSSLDKDGFVKGMWRIDEELRRLQSSRNSTIPARQVALDFLLH